MKKHFEMVDLEYLVKFLSINTSVRMVDLSVTSMNKESDLFFSVLRKNLFFYLTKILPHGPTLPLYIHQKYNSGTS